MFLCKVEQLQVEAHRTNRQWENFSNFTRPKMHFGQHFKILNMIIWRRFTGLPTYLTFDVSTGTSWWPVIIQYLTNVQWAMKKLGVVGEKKTLCANFSSFHLIAEASWESDRGRFLGATYWLAKFSVHGNVPYTTTVCGNTVTASGPKQS